MIDVIDLNWRPILFEDGKRRAIHLIRKRAAGEESFVYNDWRPVKLVTLGWRNDELIYHYHYNYVSFWNNPPKLPAGILRGNSRNLIAKPFHILHMEFVVSTLIHNSRIYPDEKCQLLQLAPVKFIHHRDILGTVSLFIVCQTVQDIIIAKMIFPDGKLFNGF